MTPFLPLTKYVVFLIVSLMLVFFVFRLRRKLDVIILQTEDPFRKFSLGCAKVAILWVVLFAIFSAIPILCRP